VLGIWQSDGSLLHTRFGSQTDHCYTHHLAVRRIIVTHTIWQSDGSLLHTRFANWDLFFSKLIFVHPFTLTVIRDSLFIYMVLKLGQSCCSRLSPPNGLPVQQGAEQASFKCYCMWWWCCCGGKHELLWTDRACSTGGTAHIPVVQPIYRSS
jgi:hypothetical protein